MAQKVITYNTTLLEHALTAIRAELAGTPELDVLEAVVSKMDHHIQNARICESLLTELVQIKMAGIDVQELLKGFARLR